MPQREHFIAHFKTVICRILIGRIILKGAPGKEHVLSRQRKNNLGHKKLLSVSIIFLSFFCSHESEFLTAVTSFCNKRTRTVSETFHKPTKLMGSNVFMQVCTLKNVFSRDLILLSRLRNFKTKLELCSHYTYYFNLIIHL